ncbi:MAG TPA: hypothetical protein VGL56_06050 [Fimbriimonadaceae bacterium]
MRVLPLILFLLLIALAGCGTDAVPPGAGKGGAPAKQGFAANPNGAPPLVPGSMLGPHKRPLEGKNIPKPDIVKSTKKPPASMGSKT